MLFSQPLGLEPIPVPRPARSCSNPWVRDHLHPRLAPSGVGRRPGATRHADVVEPVGRAVAEGLGEPASSTARPWPRIGSRCTSAIRREGRRVADGAVPKVTRRRTAVRSRLGASARPDSAAQNASFVRFWMPAVCRSWLAASSPARPIAPIIAISSTATRSALPASRRAARVRRLTAVPRAHVPQPDRGGVDASPEAVGAAPRRGSRWSGTGPASFSRSVRLRVTRFTRTSRRAVAQALGRSPASSPPGPPDSSPGLLRIGDAVVVEVVEQRELQVLDVGREGWPSRSRHGVRAPTFTW